MWVQWYRSVCSSIRRILLLLYASETVRERRCARQTEPRAGALPLANPQTTSLCLWLQSLGQDLFHQCIHSLFVPLSYTIPEVDVSWAFWQVVTQWLCSWFTGPKFPPFTHVFCAENLLASKNSGWKGVHSLTLATQAHELTLLGPMNIDSESGNLG